MTIRKQIREKLDEAETLYDRLFKVENELLELFNGELKKRGSDFEIDLDTTTDYFDYVMRKKTDLAEMKMLHELTGKQIEVMTKSYE